MIGYFLCVTFMTPIIHKPTHSCDCFNRVSERTCEESDKNIETHCDCDCVLIKFILLISILLKIEIKINAYIYDIKMKNGYINNASLFKIKGKKIMRTAPVKMIRNQKIIVVPPLVIARPFFDLQPYL